MVDDNTINLLVVILDVNPVWWGRIAAERDQIHEEVHISLTGAVDSLLVFCNSHLMLRHNNCLCFIVSHITTSKFVFPKEDTSNSPAENQKDLPTDGKYEGFANMNDSIISELKQLLTLSNTQVDRGTETPPTLLASALSRALCYIHRADKECPEAEIPNFSEWSTFSLLNGNFDNIIIKVVKASPDVSSQYMPIMNCIFAAQKSNIVIDACVVDEDSGFLQQAADITGGTYLKVPQTLALLQYLLWVFLPEVSVRDQLVLPSSLHIDYRAACFCHRRLVDIGFVCSVCLSIYCQFRPFCLTCQTRFKLPALPIARPKKKKKENTAPGK